MIKARIKEDGKRDSEAGSEGACCRAARFGTRGFVLDI